MDLQADIKWIQKELNKVEDATLLQAIKNILKYRAKGIHSERISIEQYNKELDEAEADIEAGNYYTTDEARKIASQWGR
jgi:hypothetical protein